MASEATPSMVSSVNKGNLVVNAPYPDGASFWTCTHDTASDELLCTQARSTRVVQKLPHVASTPWETLEPETHAFVCEAQGTFATPQGRQEVTLCTGENSRYLELTKALPPSLTVVLFGSFINAFFRGAAFSLLMLGVRWGLQQVSLSQARQQQVQALLQTLLLLALGSWVSLLAGQLAYYVVRHGLHASEAKAQAAKQVVGLAYQISSIFNPIALAQTVAAAAGTTVGAALVQKGIAKGSSIFRPTP